jgi:hypothetical protein
VLGLRYKLSIVVTTLMASVTLTLVILLLMLVLRVVLRRAWLATAVSWLALTALLVLSQANSEGFAWIGG